MSANIFTFNKERTDPSSKQKALSNQAIGKTTEIQESETLDFSQFSAPRLAPSRNGAKNAAVFVDFQTPVIVFVNEICDHIKHASDQAMLPRPTIGLNKVNTQELNLSQLLSSLERGEKFLDLIASSKPGFDPCTNISRVIALNCSSLVRALRRDLICGKEDPTRPNHNETSALVELLDSTSFRLKAERIKLEDLLLTNLDG
jgi:hypothetical protein